MTTRSKSSKPKFTKKEWDFRFGPVRIGTNRPLASIAEHWAETEAVLRNYLVESLQEERLPASVVLAQFISVPPQYGKSPINLRVPAVTRESDPKWMTFLQGFAYTAHFAQTAEGFSFHNRATQLLKTPGTTIVVFTTEQAAPQEHPFDGVNVIWVQMKDVTSVLVAHIAGIDVSTALLRKSERGFKLAHVGDILELKANRKAFRHKVSGTQMAIVRVYPKTDLDQQEEKMLREFIANTLGTDDGPVALNPYLKHVASSVSCGPVILALPKKVYLNDQTQNALVDNSGLTTLFREGTILTYAEMEDCFRIAHRLSTAFTSLYGVVHSVAESEASKRRQLRDFALESAAHVLIGPIADFTNWLREMRSGVSDTVAIDCAVAALGIAKRNAETVLAIAPLEEKSDKIFALTPTEVVEVVEELLDSLGAEFRTCHRLEVSIVLDARKPLIAHTNKALLLVALSKLLRNAFEHVLEHKPRKQYVKAPALTIGVEFEHTLGQLKILISNPGPVPKPVVFDRLNSPPVLDVSALLSRKGPMHYGFGTETAKWLIEDKLCGTVRWRADKGRFICEVALPSSDQTNACDPNE